MKNLFHFIWGLPQNIIGAILYLIFSRNNATIRHKEAFVCKMPNKWGSISLGMFLLVTDTMNKRLICHEYGHTKQSLLLGPLYLLFIGLPSILWAGLGKKYREKHNVSYYSFYTEKWANKLGGLTDATSY